MFSRIKIISRILLHNKEFSCISRITKEREFILGEGPFYFFLVIAKSFWYI